MNEFQPDADTSLSILLFGPFEARVCGQPLPPLRSGKGLRLLALLALQGGRSLSRVSIAETLWPESLEALGSLRQSLSDLRRALGPASRCLTEPIPHTLALEVGEHSPDTRRFSALIEQGDPESMDEAVGLYRGPLLEGWDEEWLIQDREYYEQAYLKALEKLAEHSLANGDRDRAADFLRRAAAASPLHQKPHRDLMRLLMEARDYSAAMDVYTQLRDRLHQMYRMEPDPETTHIREELQRITAPTPHPDAPVPDPTPSPDGPDLPRPLTELIGREESLNQARSRFMTSRLVTLTGPGGVGKTRLAIELAWKMAESYPGGVFLVDLTSLSDPGLLPQALTERLGLVESQGRTSADLAIEHLRHRHALVILDNCEHLLDACTRLARDLLAACPHLHILCTSHQKLGLPAEVVCRVPPLSLPRLDPALTREAALQSTAVQLFVERAGAAYPEFQLTDSNAGAAAQICHRLDGLPLAIELAAPLVEVLPLKEIARRLDDRFHLVPEGDSTRPARHGTLQAMMDWSYDLLARPDRVLFEELSVFTAGWTFEAAEAVCSAYPLPGLTHLAARSLLIGEGGEEGMRYRMLETIREYAAERLRGRGASPKVMAGRLDYYTSLAEEAAPELTGPQQAQWLNRLEREHDNFRAALDADGPPALRLAGALGRFWQIRGFFAEGRRRLERELEAAPDRTAVRAKALNWAGSLTMYGGDYTAARAHYQEALDIWRELGDRTGIAGSLGCLGVVAKDGGDYAAARPLFEESLELSREEGDERAAAGALGYLGIVAAAMGDCSAARSYYEESLAIRQRQGDRWGIAASLNNLGLLARQEQDYPRARTLLEESLVIRRELDDRRCMAITLNNLGAIALAEGKPDGAGQFFAESLDLCLAIGDRLSTAYALESFARLSNDPQRAARLYGAAAALRENVGSARPPAERPAHEQEINRLRDTLGDTAFEAAFAEGGRAPLEDAVRWTVVNCQLSIVNCPTT